MGLLLANLLLLCLVVVVALAATSAAGDEVGTGGEQAPLAPTAEQTREALEISRTEAPEQAPETEPKVAEELPHRDLDDEEALELVEGVFGAAVEDPAGIYGELEPEKFLSDNAAVVAAGSLPGTSEEGGQGEGAAPGLGADQPVLLESTLPLRTENAEGEEEPVDLTLQSPEGSGGELRPENPLAELSIPAHLEEGISLAGIGIAVVGTAGSTVPTNVEGDYAFYPNVADDTDLIVAPVPTGVETMTAIRSAAAPTSTTYDLSLPSGATLKESESGGAEVLENGAATLVVAPPTATDAAGEAVPVRLEVEGDGFRVVTSPGPDAAYPILVDPAITETWSWSSGHDSLAAWSPSTTQWSLCPVGYAYWMGPQYPGLGLVAGCDGNSVPSGTHADWTYVVPRYQSDISTYGSPPTSFVYQFTTQGVQFVEYGQKKDYPALVWGITNLTTGWDARQVHYGHSGDMTNWSATETFTNATANPNDKGAQVELITLENESSAPRRDTFVGAAAVAAADEDAPRILKLTAPTRWMNTTPEPIPYEFEDPGLGVKSATIGFGGTIESGWGLDLGCVGTTAAPCPRFATSTGQKALAYDPTKLPTGEDTLAVNVGDPLSGVATGHATSGSVIVNVDHRGPEISLSGALTEQETRGTRLAEYPLTVKATDGTAETSQSGVAKVEVKVDGKKVTMPSESAWAPNCQTKNCSFSGLWTMKASEYSGGTHEVEVVATDAIGNVTASMLEVEVGHGPPQTSFTSPHPTYDSHEIPTISFKATREGAPVEGATFRCSLDGATEIPTTPCTSPYRLPGHLEPNKWHLLLVQAVDKSGKADPTPARWRFQTGEYPPVPAPASAAEKLVFPEVGKKTASYYTLEAEWGPNPEGKAGQGVSGVSFEVELPVEKAQFQPVPAACVMDGQGKSVTWPIPARSNPGHNQPVYLKVRGCPIFEEAGYPEKGVLFRAVFDGGEKVAGASSPNATEFVGRGNQVTTDATESVGPAQVDLLTGALSMTATDVSIPVPGYEANLEFTRTYNSIQDKYLPGNSTVLGGAWQPSLPLESEAVAQAWTRVEEKVIPYHPKVWGHECWTEHEVEEEEEIVVKSEETPCPPDVESNCPPSSCEKWLEEEEQPEVRWIELINNEGAGIPFQISGSNYISPEWAKELVLRRQGQNFVLGYPNGTHTSFVPDGPLDWLPKFISYQANSNSMRMVYETSPTGLLLTEEIAPSPVTCEDAIAIHTVGCRTLVFGYEERKWNSGSVKLLHSIRYFGPSGASAGEAVAEYNYAEFEDPAAATYVATASGVKKLLGKGFDLTGETDPRLARLAQSYSYAPAPHGTLLTSLTPPGEAPWRLEYVEATKGYPRLKSVSRGGSTTTLAYGVPVKGTGAPYDMSPESISRWGQVDLPVDATAVFPPSHVPSSYPPSEYSGAIVHYMDPEGHQVNIASPSPPGVSGASITTTEADVKGDVVRELTPRDRLTALESAEPATRARELDSHSVYNASGTELLESWGPVHQVRTQSGEVVQARRHTTTRYDEGAPISPAGTPPAYLPTKEIVGALVPGRESELEPKVTETHYDWNLRKPTETIIDPGGLNIRSVTAYNAAGQVTETRQPKGPDGGTAGDKRTYYYTAGQGGTTSDCVLKPQYANLPCKIIPEAQVSGSGRPQLPVKKFTAYNDLDEPTEVVEGPGEAPAESRRTITSFDSAGRMVSTKVLGGGVALARTEARDEVSYSPTTGAPTTQQFVCERECAGFDSQATSTTYNGLGQVTEYEDADGAKTRTTYDALGRPSTVTDERGTQTLHYDEASGRVTSMDVSGVGTFTASFDADGNLIARGLPNGLTARTTYNAADEPIKLTYTKTSSCGESCTWYEESLERSIEGRILSSSSSLTRNRYSYDKDGRLTEAQETPTGGQCTSRAYTFDADSNRLTKATRTGVAGACATSGGTIQKYEYDEADRLTGSGLIYDAWGRITNLPGEYAGGKELATSYFSNDMVASQSQGGVTNTFQLDSSGRQRQREQAGGVAGTEVFHYGGPGDAPTWTALGATWSRNVPGMGGELAAVQESTGTTTFKLTDLHGDVVASASSSPTATKLLGSYRFSEFGEPLSSAAPGRFGWLGSSGRRTELSSGVIQMGARSYIPQLGRFLTPDPQPGGSANPYDYAFQDPINNFDLTGECTDVKGHRICHGKRERKELHAVLARATRQTHREIHRRKVELGIANAPASYIPGVTGIAPGPGVHLEDGSPSLSSLASAAVTWLESTYALSIDGPVGLQLTKFLGNKFGTSDAVSGCAKEASDAWAATAELRTAADSSDGKPGLAATMGIAGLDAALSCAAGALP